MKTLYYRSLTPSAAAGYIGSSGYVVWGFVDDPSGAYAVTCSASVPMPSGAYAAFVASTDSAFSAGDALFSVELASDKDPQSPPPPPALQSAIAAYVTSGEVASYRDDVQRDLSRPA